MYNVHCTYVLNRSKVEVAGVACFGMLLRCLFFRLSYIEIAILNNNYGFLIPFAAYFIRFLALDGRFSIGMAGCACIWANERIVLVHNLFVYF